jgi:hypothetical protein
VMVFTVLLHHERFTVVFLCTNAGLRGQVRTCVDTLIGSRIRRSTSAVLATVSRSKFNCIDTVALIIAKRRGDERLRLGRVA